MNPNRLKRFVLVSAVFAFGVVESVPVAASASAPDPITTSVAETSTTVAGTTDTSTTVASQESTGETSSTVPPETTGEPAVEVASKSGPDLMVVGQPLGAPVPGFPFVGKVTVSNVGSAVAGETAPVAFRIAGVPAFATLRDVTPTMQANSPVGTVAWQCSNSTCTLVERRADGVGNATLVPGRGFGAYVRFDVAQDAVIPAAPSGLIADLRESGTVDLNELQEIATAAPSIDVAASLAGDVSSANDSASVPMWSATPAQYASNYVDLALPGSVYPGGLYRAEMRLLVIGSDVQSGDITLKDVVSPLLKLSGVSVSGTGWTCDDPSNPKVCTHTGANREPGEFSDSLVITGRVGSDVTTSATPVAWEIVATGKSAAGADVTSSGTPSVLVSEAPAPDMTVSMVVRDGIGSLAVGQPVTVDVGVRSGNGLGQAVAATVQVPAGLRIEALVADSDKNWKCIKLEQEAVKNKFGDGLQCVIENLDAGEQPALAATVSVAEDGKDGPATILASVSAFNETKDLATNNTATQSVVVVPQPTAMPGIVVTRADEKGAKQVVVDGSATEIAVGRTTKYDIAVANLGAKEMEAGTVLRIEQFVSEYAGFSGDSFSGKSAYSAALDEQTLTGTAGKWVCATGTATQPNVTLPASDGTVTATAPSKSGPAVRCEITLAAPLAPKAKSPVLEMVVKPSKKAKVGTPEWPIFASLPADAEIPVARYGMTMSVVEYTPELLPSIVAPAGPRPGGQAAATISVRNDGNADATSQYVVVPGIKNGRVTGADGEGWECSRIGGLLAAGFTVCSRNDILKAGEESPSVSVNYDSLDSAAKSLTLSAASIVATDSGVATARVSNLPVELRPGISFTVKGPDQVIDQIIDAKGNRVASTILFSTEGNAAGAAFTWKQLCTTDAAVKASNGECKKVAPVVKWLNNAPSTGPTASLITPKVAERTTLDFEVSATEAGAVGTTRVSVVVVPLPTAAGPTGKMVSGAGSSVLRRVPAGAMAPARTYASAPPTSGAGDAAFTNSGDVEVTVFGNIYGVSTVAPGAPVSLTALASGVGAVSYSWVQAAGPSTSVIAAAASNAATVSFTAPNANTTLLLRVTATDSRGLKATDIVSITVGSGGAPAISANITEGDGPIVVDTATAFKLNATGAGSGAIKYSWTQISGTTLTLQNANTSALTIAATSATGSAVLMVTTTDGSNKQATDQITLKLVPSGAPTPLCNFVEAVSAKSTSKISDILTAIGITGVNLNQFAVSAATCTAASTVTFADAGFSLAGYFAVSGASGTISATGLTIRSARFTGPSDWGSPQFAIAASDPVGLFVPFSRASATVGALEGEIISGTMPFLKLSGGFVPEAALRFSVDAEGNKAMSLDARAAAPEKNGKVPSARVFGALSTAGTYALEASMTNAVDLFGTVVDFAGSVKKTDAVSRAKVALSGSLTGSVSLANKVTLTNLAAALDETGVVTGAGSITVGEGDSALIVSANLSYTDAKNHSLNVTAAPAGGAWKPAADVSIALASASGSYVSVNGAKDINITVVGGTVTPFTGLKLVAPQITATAKCTDGATCNATVAVTSNVEVTLGGTAATGSLSGSFDLEKKAASLTATLGKVPVVAGLELTSASLTIASTNMGAANATSTITVSGSMSAFDKTVTASATFSKAGILLTADLPEIAPFGASGPTFKPGQLSWATGAISITPKVPSLPNLAPITLTPKVPRLNAAIALPKEITDFATSAVSGVSDILLNGDVDFSTGKFSLAASLTNAAIDASGSVGRDGTGQGYKYALTGKIKQPVALNGSVRVTSLDFTFGNTTAGSAPKFAGSGSVDVTLPDATVLAVKGALTYNSSTDFTVALSVGTTAPSFGVNGGEALSLGTASGTFTRNAAGTTLNIDLSSSATWKPLSGLTVSAVTAKAALTCATGATCVPTFNVKGTLGFDLGISGLRTANVEGSLDANGFRFSATFSDLTFAADIKLTAPTLTLTIPAKTSTDKATAKLSGNFTMFGATVSAAVEFSSAGALLTGTFPAFKFPSSDVGFDGGQFAWLIKAPSSVSWTPQVPNLTLPAVTLPTGAPRINLSMPIPDAVKQLTGGTGVAFGAVSVSGNMTLSSGAFAMTATYASAAIDVSGSVSRTGTSAALLYSLSAKVKSPVTVVDGVKIDALDLALSNATGSVVVNGSGGLTVSTTTTPISLGFTLRYNSATDYSFSVATAAGKTSSWSPFSGLTIPLNGITGSMSRSGNTKALSIGIKATSDFVPFPGIKVSEPGASISSTCVVGSSCVIAFNASGKVYADLGAGFQGPAVVGGTFGSDSSSLTATFPDITVTPGVVISKPTLTLGHSKTAGLSASVSGSSSILGTVLTLSATFSSQGVLIAGGMNDWTPIPGGPTLTATQFVYSTYALANVTLPSAPALGALNVAKNAPVLAAGFAVPQWLRDFLKQPELKSVPVVIDLKSLAGGKLPTLQIMLPTPNNWFIMNTSEVSLRFTALGFEITGSPSPAMSLIGNLELKTGSSATAVPFEVRGTVSTTSFTLSASLGKDPKTGGAFAWTNAFGISGLTLTEAAVSIGFTYTSPIGIPLPIIGIAANAQLPAAWRSSLGMDAGAAVRLVANLDISKPCFSFRAGTLGADKTTISAGTAKVVSIGGGVLTSTYMDLTIAPLGCTVGNVVLDPGVSVGFSGTVLGTPIDVRAKIGTSPFSLEASIAIGGFKAGPVQLDDAVIAIKVSPTDNFVAFSGGVTVGATKVSVSGKAGINTTDGPYLDMTGSIANLVIVPALIEIRTASVTLNLKPTKGTANVVASGDYIMLGAPSRIEVVVQMANYQLQSLSGQLQTRRTVGVVTIDGLFTVAYTKGQAPEIKFDATGSVAGYQLGRVTGFLNANQINITGTASISGVFSAQVNGQVVWSAAPGITIGDRNGNQVAAQSGDFRVAATNVGLNIGGFAASGSIALGKVGSLVYGDFGASFTVGSGDVGGSLNVAGSFDTSGNFSLTGSGRLSLVGFTADVQVSGSKTGTAWALSLKTDLKVMGAINVSLKGAFSSQNGRMKFMIAGDASLQPMGLPGTSASFQLSNGYETRVCIYPLGITICRTVEVPGGFTAGLSVNVGGIVKASGSMSIGSDGSFDATARADLKLPGVSAEGNLKISNVRVETVFENQTIRVGPWKWTISVPVGTKTTRVNPYLRINGSANVFGMKFGLEGDINSDGSFRFVASASGSWNSSTFDFGVGQARAGADFSGSLTVTSSSPYIALSVSGSAYAESRWPKCDIWYPDCYWGGWGGRVTAGLSFSTNPFKLSLRILGENFTIG
jgi:hypothetical protein